MRFFQQALIKWALVAVIVLIAIFSAILFATRERHEIAPQLRIHHNIDDIVIMNVRNISNGLIEVYITNCSSVHLLFGYASFSIEHFDSLYWRVLPVRRDVVFPSIGLAIFPNSGSTHNMNFAWFHHQPRHGELYRVRLETFVEYRDRNPGHLTIIHDIVAEFIYNAEQL